MIWLRLLRSRRVGVATFYRLLREHGSAAAALDALPDVARAAGVANYDPCPEAVVLAEMKAARRQDARMVCIGDPHYPPDLAEIADAPPILWVIGAPQSVNRPMVALVGARNASSLGLRMARALAGGLAEAGYVVVSGLARGIDTAAHTASVESGTVAVMAGGADILYPAENALLGKRISDEGGARLSEQPMGMQPIARHFPTRNRIISGMAQAVVVVEAAAKSGSLITARGALDQGREVLAVPGHPLDARASGCNMLIRDGARLVRNVDDIIEALPPRDGPPMDVPRQAELDLPPPDGASTKAREVAPFPPKPGPEPARKSLGDTAALHDRILQRLGPSPIAEDQLIRDLNAASARVSPALTELELDGRIERHPGGLLSLNMAQ